MVKLKKVLIIGGSSSICDDIIAYLEKNNFEIDILTYRDQNKINNKYRWEYLDLTDQDSVNNLINILPNDYYDKVICVPTYNSGSSNPFETTREYLNEVYGKFIINYMILIRNLFKKITDNGHIIYISSQSAIIPVDMVDYSAAKGAMQTYVRSLSRKVKENQVIFTIAPTMIYESMPFYLHDPEHYGDDIDKLVRKEDIAKVIVNANKNYNGKIICLGFLPDNPFDINEKI